MEPDQATAATPAGRPVRQPRTGLDGQNLATEQKLTLAAYLEAGQCS
jgi:hypothetical protein